MTKPTLLLAAVVGQRIKGKNIAKSENSFYSVSPTN